MLINSISFFSFNSFLYNNNNNNNNFYKIYFNNKILKKGESENFKYQKFAQQISESETFINFSDEKLCL